MTFTALLISFIVALLLAKSMIPFILLITYKKRLFDPVDARKIHQHRIPRLGGVAFAPIQCCLLVLAILLVFKLEIVHMQVESWAILPSFMLLICGLVILFIVGLGDDLIGIDYKWKFATQIFVASLFPLSGLWLNDLYGLFFLQELPFWFGALSTIFIVVLIINAINLMDGLDGLCAGIVGVGTLLLGIVFMYYGAWLHALFAFITLGVIIPFFYYNVFGTSKKKRKIFMGDTGSMTLGYSMAFLTISFSMHNSYIKPFTEGAIVVAFSTLIIPIFDVARVMYVRWRIRKPLFKPDRNHLHHKLLRCGLNQSHVMLVILALSLFFSCFNLIMVQLISNNIVVLLDVLLWFVFHFLFNKYQNFLIKRNKIQSLI